MKLIGKTFAVLAGLSLLGAMAFGAYFAFQCVVALFAGLDPQVANVTAIACFVALAAAWWIARAVRAAIRQGKAMTVRDERTAAYQLFVDYWENRLRVEQTQTDRLPAGLSEKLQVLDRLLALYGGASVIRAHTRLRDLAREGRGQQSDLRAGFGEALIAIRKDLGADTPSDLAQDLERLLLPAPDVRPTLAPSA